MHLYLCNYDVTIVTFSRNYGIRLVFTKMRYSYGCLQVIVASTEHNYRIYQINTRCRLLLDNTKCSFVNP